MALLEVDDLHVDYPVRGAWFGRKKFLHAVNGVSFALDRGDIVGLVGESGCGKSTLGRALVRLETSGGRIMLHGRDLGGLSGGELRRARKSFQMIFQDPYGSLNPQLSIARTLDEVLALHVSGDRAARRVRAAELLEKVGLDASALDRYPHQFSGGQRQRIGIARALAAEPEFIVADEPVSALDVSVQAAIINLLSDIRRDTGAAFLFIAHDLAVVEHISDRIMVMYLGRIVEEGGAHELVASPRHPYTCALLSAVPRIEHDGRKRLVLPGDVPSPLAPPPGCAFHTRCTRCTERCRVETPRLAPLADGSSRRCACFNPIPAETVTP
ncbi:MAG: ATP-binding cassette domain-containing protein [Victivallaceae bacterium]|nr:ATP-binding cassette domain-containing protein [Victivallaceae bacterium]